MSEKKSWDIAPRKRVVERVEPARREPRVMRDMQPRVAKVEHVSIPVQKKDVTLVRRKQVRAPAPAPLKKRRREKKKFFLYILGGIVFALCALALYLIWLPALRIQDVAVQGPHADEAVARVQQGITGTHALVVPRNSLFFIPEQRIRADILNAYPDVETVSFSAHGLTTLVLTLTPRTPVFSWCGVDETALGGCFSATAEGFVFAPQFDTGAPGGEILRVYAPLDRDVRDSPIRAHVIEASRIPEALRFVEALRALGIDVVSLFIRGDEADLRTASGFRITYVLGHEQDAITVATSIFPEHLRVDGEAQYVDLRFPGRAFFKREATESQE